MTETDKTVKTRNFCMVEIRHAFASALTLNFPSEPATNRLPETLPTKIKSEKKTKLGKSTRNKLPLVSSRLVQAHLPVHKYYRVFKWKRSTHHECFLRPLSKRAFTTLRSLHTTCDHTCQTRRNSTRSQDKQINVSNRIRVFVCI